MTSSSNHGISGNPDDGLRSAARCAGTVGADNTQTVDELQRRLDELLVTRMCAAISAPFNPKIQADGSERWEYDLSNLSTEQRRLFVCLMLHREDVR